LIDQGLPDFSWYCIPKREKFYQITKNIPNGHTRMYRSKALHNLPKLVFLVWKYTIWQTRHDPSI
jgi:hypothetical protein